MSSGDPLSISDIPNDTLCHLGLENMIEQHRGKHCIPWLGPNESFSSSFREIVEKFATPAKDPYCIGVSVCRYKFSLKLQWEGI